MKPGQHAAGDGSFGRSSGVAAGRAAALLAVAVVLGVVLLNAADDVPRQRLSAGDAPETTVRRAVTTTTAPTTTTTSPARQPKDVKVISANGTTVRGAAGKVRDMLQEAGYNVLAPGDAKRADASAVYFTPGYDREAVAVAEVLGLPTSAVKPLPSPAPVTDLRGANVAVVVGPELAERLASTGDDRTTTTTRRARSTSTTRGT
ncbi:MAG: LytR C-terminal domain-containing protein [Actinomycetota bacterium]|nr:LytR C-terminal domain-containing protein [Actinomycetota bacterium]